MSSPTPLATDTQLDLLARCCNNLLGALEVLVDHMADISASGRGLTLAETAKVANYLTNGPNSAYGLLDQLSPQEFPAGASIAPVEQPAAASAILTVYDSTTAADIPANAEGVLVYVDGAYAWSEDDRARFAHVSQWTITVNGSRAANLADMEPGNLTPQQAADLYHNSSVQGVYCSAASVGVMNALGVPTAALLVADWTGAPHDYPGAPGCQYASPGWGSGGHYDISRIRAGAFGVQPAG